MTFPIISLLVPLLLGAGFAMVYFPVSIFLRSWLHDSHRAGNEADKDKEDPAISREDARELLLQLHSVASNVGRDVSAHSDTMEAITQDLEKDQGPTTEKVMAAMERIVLANGTLKSQLEEAKATIDEQAAVIGSQIADALTDALTGVPNRRAFDQEFQRCLAEFRREGRPFCLAMCDVDRFKGLNDTYGHVAGDEVLREIANRVATKVREMDLPARYGGEEFGILLPNTRLQDATTVVERVRSAICETPVVWESEALDVSASFGVTECLGGEETESSIVKRADEALYASKNAGRNCSHLHSGDACEPIGTSVQLDTGDESAGQEPSQEDSAYLGTGLCDDQSDELAQPEAVGASRLLQREAFDEELAERVTQFRRDGGELSAILLEVDDYESVAAESLALGLPVMGALAQLVIAAVGTAGVPARYSDRQFAALLCNTGIDGASLLASRLQRAVNSCDILNGPNAGVTVGVSIGVAAAEADDVTGCLQGRLVLALREACQAGGRCVYVHHEGRTAPADDAGIAAMPV